MSGPLRFTLATFRRGYAGTFRCGAVPLHTGESPLRAPMSDARAPPLPFVLFRVYSWLNSPVRSGSPPGGVTRPTPEGGIGNLSTDGSIKD